MRQLEHTFRGAEINGLRAERGEAKGSFKWGTCTNIIAEESRLREPPSIVFPISNAKLTNAGILNVINARMFIGKQFRFLVCSNKLFWVDVNWNIVPVKFKLVGDLTEQELYEPNQNITSSTQWSFAEYGDSFVLTNGKICYFRVAEDLSWFICPEPDELGYLDLNVFATDVGEPYSAMRPKIVMVFQDRCFMFGGGLVNGGLFGDLPNDCFIWSDVGFTDVKQILTPKEDL